MTSLTLQAVMLGVVALFLGSTPVAAYAECDPHIVEIIQTAIWAKNTPKDIIKTAKDNGKEVVVATSDGYYPKDTYCVSSLFKDDKLEITLIPSEGKPNVTTVPIKEEKGTLVSETDGITVYRYHIFLDQGVTAFYTCSKRAEDSNKKDKNSNGPQPGTTTGATGGAPTQEPSKTGDSKDTKVLEGAVKVKANGYDKEVLKKAKKALTDLGVKLAKEFDPEKCGAEPKPERGWFKSIIHTLGSLL